MSATEAGTDYREILRIVTELTKLNNLHVLHLVDFQEVNEFSYSW